MMKKKTRVYILHYGSNLPLKEEQREEKLLTKRGEKVMPGTNQGLVMVSLSIYIYPL